MVVAARPLQGQKNTCSCHRKARSAGVVWAVNFFKPKRETVKALLCSLTFVLAGGCSSFGRVSSLSDPRVAHSSLVVISCGSEESFFLKRIAVGEDGVTGVGIRHDIRCGRWEKFNGVVPATTITHVYARQLDPRRTFWCGMGLLLHLAVAVTLWRVWSPRKARQRLPHSDEPAGSFGAIAGTAAVIARNERRGTGASTVIRQYRQSLKFTGGEELLDLLVHRPLGFLLVKAVQPLPISANHLTGLSVLVFLLAASFIASGDSSSVALAGVLILLGNVLDCADGQLARLRGTSSHYGRIVDGAADYISLVSIFIGFALWQPAWEMDRFLWASLAVGAMVSFGWQSALVDYYRNEFSLRLAGKVNFVREEIRSTERELERAVGSSKLVQRIALRGNLAYHTVQRTMQRSLHQLDRVPVAEYLKANSLLVRLWCLNGSATPRFLMVVFCFFNRPDLLVAYVLIVGTLWTGLLLACQKRGDRQLLRRFA